MEYTELSAYRLHAGFVTEWTPQAADSAWSEDARPLSVEHEHHVLHALEQRESGTRLARGDNWIGTALRIRAPYREDAVRQALRNWIARHEAYRTSAVPGAVPDAGGSDRADSTDGLGSTGGTHGSVPLRRLTVPADRIDVDPRSLDRCLDASEVSAHLDRHFATGVSALDWPHITVVTVLPERDGAPDEQAGWFTMVFAADHAVMDAYTQIVSIAELRELYGAAVESREPRLRLPGSHADFARAERALADTVTADHPAVRRWRRFADAANEPGGAMPRFPLPVGDGGADETKQASTSVQLLGGTDAEAFNQIARTHGGNQTAGLLAALKLAYTRILAEQAPESGTRPFRYVMPMHTRSSPEFALSAGWFVGLMPVHDQAEPDELFSTAIHTTRQAVTVDRELVAYPYPQVAELAGITDTPRFVISIVDTRHVPGSDEWTPHDRTLRGTAYSDSDVYFWIVRNADGVNISMRYPDNPTALSSLRSLITEYFTVLHTVVDTGDAYSVPFQDPRFHTPSPVQAV